MNVGTANLILGLISLIREAMNQMDMSRLDELPPETRDRLINDSRALTTEWGRLAPPSMQSPAQQAYAESVGEEHEEEKKFASQRAEQRSANKRNTDKGDEK